MMSEPDLKLVARELHDIKMLLVLQLITADVKQGTIARFLGVSDATVSRMIPAGVSKKKKKKADIPRESSDGSE
jgi:predicted transcriptional regulator